MPKLARRILSTYAIGQATAVRPLVELLLQTLPPPEASRAAAEVCESAVAAADGDAGAAVDEGNADVAAGEDGETLGEGGAGGDDVPGPPAADSVVLGGRDAGPDAAPAPGGLGRRLKLCASDGARAAALQVSVRHGARCLSRRRPRLRRVPPAPRSAQVAFGVLRTLIDGAAAAPLGEQRSLLLSLLPGLAAGAGAVFASSHSVAKAPTATGRLVALMSAMLSLSLRACTALSRAKRASGRAATRATGAVAAEEASGAVPTAGWDGVWAQLLPLMHSYHGWLRDQAESWPLAARRRVPSAIYVCEKLLAQLRAFLLVPRTALASPDVDAGALSQVVPLLHADWGAESSAAPAQPDDDDTALNDAADRAPAPRASSSSRRRQRSRNPFIDAELGAGGGEGDDSYADLEDFIVCKVGRKY